MPFQSFMDRRSDRAFALLIILPVLTFAITLCVVLSAVLGA